MQRRGARIGAPVPPAMYPDESRTPGLISASAALRRLNLSDSQRIMPPQKIGVEADSGKYTPTAKGREGTPLSSRTMAMATPKSTSDHGNRSEERRVGKECRSRWS